MIRFRSPVFLFVICFFLAGCTMWQAKPTAWSNSTGAEQFERLWWQEVKAKNWTEVERHLAATYVSSTSSGVLDRAAALQRLQKLAISDYSIGDFNVVPNGADMVVTYSMTMQGTLDGQAVSLQQTRMMTVWQQEKKGWVAIAHSESR